MKFIKDELLFLAERNKDGYPFSACIYYNKKHYYTVNEVYKLNDPTAHAEIMAIRKVCQENNVYELKNAIIYSSGEPCPMCLTAIAWTGIKEVYFIDNYSIANEKGFKIDQNCFIANKNLNLNLNIRRF